MKINEVTRRGFLKGVAGLAAATALPVNTIEKLASASHVTPENLNIFSQMVQTTNLKTASNFVKMWVDAGTIADVHPREDLKAVWNAIKDFPEFKYSTWQSAVSEYMEDHDIPEIEQLIGRELEVSKIFNIINSHNLDSEDFSQDVYKFQSELVNKNVTDSTQWGHDWEISKPTASNTVSKTVSNVASDARTAVTASKLPGNITKAVGALKTLYNKFAAHADRKSADKTDPTQSHTPDALPAPTHAALPSPSQSEFDLTPDLSRIKDLAGIKKKG